ncbi:alpha 1,2-mannosyltransferase 2.4.1 [Dissophora globulifera]|uniref:Alpha 1,2-mannosyltransferase 2.4.1 n=1 Tax=Dissophora globulifera TaxID=979702 RepID=A0A9P6RDE7_9FUNG|nr:alpha 1,2-mannosyltransferase 2.4.1 [Dissophora globulifera]
MEPEDEHDDDDDNNDGAGNKGSSLLGTVPDLERHHHDDAIPYDQSYNESEKANGVLVMIIYSHQLQSARETIRQIQDRFNRNHRYPWLILSPLPLSPRSQRHIQDLTKESTMTFGTIPHEQWRLPTWIEAGRVRNGDYAKMKYGMNKTSLAVRHKWRYASGFLAQHPLLDSYEIFWRIDPGVDIYCDLEEDPMLALAKSGKKFGWSLSSTANEAGIPDAWSIIQKFRTEFPQLIPEVNDETFLTKGSGDAFSGCTYGVQNSIARLDFLRSPAYLSYFTFIDQDGPIYYHKWDDATVITIGLSLLAPRTDQLFLTQLGWGFLDSSSSSVA